MHTLKTTLAALALFAALLAFAQPASAEERERHEITIIDEDGVAYVCRYDDETLRVYNKETGEELAEVDFAEIEEAVERAMREVEGALEEAFAVLEDLEIDMHIGGKDNRFSVDTGEQRVTIDFDELLASIGEALGDIRIDGVHHGSHDRHYRDDDHLDQLMREIEGLKAEIKDLKKELKSSSF